MICRDTKCSGDAVDAEENIYPMKEMTRTLQVQNARNVATQEKIVGQKTTIEPIKVVSD